MSLYLRHFRRYRHYARQQWWHKSIVEAVEQPYASSPNEHRRVTKHAETLAANGAVLNYQRYNSSIAGLIRGTQREPFTASLTFRSLPEEELQTIAQACADNPHLMLELEEGEIPQTLFPLYYLQEGDLLWDCSCPRFTSGCVHTIALAYITIDQWVDRPWEYLSLRGLDNLPKPVSHPPQSDHHEQDHSLHSSHPLRKGEGKEPNMAEAQSLAASIRARSYRHPQHESASPQERFWLCSAPLPPLPTPETRPFYKDADPLMWDKITRALVCDSYSQEEGENDMIAAWDHLTQHSSRP